MEASHKNISILAIFFIEANAFDHGVYGGRSVGTIRYSRHRNRDPLQQRIWLFKSRLSVVCWLLKWFKTQLIFVQNFFLIAWSRALPNQRTCCNDTNTVSHYRSSQWIARDFSSDSFKPLRREVLLCTYVTRLPMRRCYRLSHPWHRYSCAPMSLGHLCHWAKLFVRNIMWFKYSCRSCWSFGCSHFLLVVLPVFSTTGSQYIRLTYLSSSCFLEHCLRSWIL